MKIQSSKPEPSQASTANKPEESLLTQSNAPTNFFSDIIAEMMSQSFMQYTGSNEKEEFEKTDLNRDENQIVNEEKLGPTTNSMSTISPKSDGLSNLDLIKQENVINTSQNAQVTLNQLTNFKKQNNNSFSLNDELNDEMERVGNKLNDGLDKANYKNYNSLFSESYNGNSEEKLLSDKELIQVDKRQIEANISSELTSLDEKSVKKNDTVSSLSNKYNLIQDVERKDSSEVFTMMFNSQKGLVNYQADEKNKYVDMMVELGNIVTPQLASNLSAEINHNVQTPRFSQVLEQQASKSKMEMPEYELKVEVFSSSAAALGKETYSANIKIYPPELGSVLAKLKVDKNNAELFIVTDNKQVKEIVEANLTQLRENFKDADINLTKIQVDVQTSQPETNQHSDQHSKNNEFHSTNQEVNVVSKSQIVSEPAKPLSNSLVDTYA